MDTKKWPVLAQILIGLGVIGGLLNIFIGLSQENVIVIVAGIIGIAIYWNFYKFRKWALIGLNILLSLSIALSLVSIRRIPALVSLLAICYPALILFYFNSPKIKGLLTQKKI